MNEVIHTKNVPVKLWNKHVDIDENARAQLETVAQMPFVVKHVAGMPDCHLGHGSTVGSVIATKYAIIPAAVGVDIGCGMCGIKTSLTASDLPDNLLNIRSKIESSVPHGRTSHLSANDSGSWPQPPDLVTKAWAPFLAQFSVMSDLYPKLKRSNNICHLGTLGTGNHFIEIGSGSDGYLWVTVHSGSRGVGNAIGRTFIDLAKKDMKKWFISLPDSDLSYFPEESDHFNQYWSAVDWAQRFAKVNRELIVQSVLNTLSSLLRPAICQLKVVDCHHNYVSIENHFHQNLYITRKGAVRAQKGELGIVPYAMGKKTYIVRGLGNPLSFNSCSHGAGRRMSRTRAKRAISLKDHARDTMGVECRKDEGVLDESPQAYKDLDNVMDSQRDLVDIEDTLLPLLCVKG